MKRFKRYDVKLEPVFDANTESPKVRSFNISLVAESIDDAIKLAKASIIYDNDKYEVTFVSKCDGNLHSRYYD